MPNSTPWKWRTRITLAALAVSAAVFALARVPNAPVPAPPPKPPAQARPDQVLHGGMALLPKNAAGARKALAAAFADLAVSGRRAYAEYRKAPPTEAALA